MLIFVQVSIFPPHPYPTYYHLHNHYHSSLPLYPPFYFPSPYNINQPILLDYVGGALPRLPYDAKLGGSSGHVFKQASFPTSVAVPQDLCLLKLRTTWASFCSLPSGWSLTETTRSLGSASEKRATCQYSRRCL